MQLSANTRLTALLERFDFMRNFLIDYNPRFSLLKSGIARSTLARFATLGRVAQMGGVELEPFLGDLAAEIEKRTGVIVELPSDPKAPEDSTKEEETEQLKEILMKLHAGEEVGELKKEFADLLSRIDPGEIVKLEEQIIQDGVSPEEIQSLCDLHTEVFKDALDVGELPEIPAGHPVDHYLKENEVLSELLAELDALIKEIKHNGLAAVADEVDTRLAKLMELNTHYARKENQLFPVLEQHGITGPPQVMWGVDDEIRATMKKLKTALDAGDADEVTSIAVKLLRAVAEMQYKEEKILFPMAMETISEKEWVAIADGDAQIGYCWIEPTDEWLQARQSLQETIASVGPELELSVGKLSLEQIDLLFRHLPVDISFVDENDKVRFYNDCPHRFFPRSPGVIGREVQKCHPPKSLDTVNEILAAFKKGEKDVAEFWIEMHGRFLYIRYFAVRDGDGSYRGCLEVGQDVTDIRYLEGERRLLDWSK